MNLSDYINQKAGVIKTMQMAKMPKNTQGYIKFEISAIRLGQAGDDASSALSDYSDIGTINDFDWEDNQEKKQEKRKIGQLKPPTVQRDAFSTDTSTFAKPVRSIGGPIKPTIISRRIQEKDEKQDDQGSESESVATQKFVKNIETHKSPSKFSLDSIKISKGGKPPLGIQRSNISLKKGNFRAPKQRIIQDEDEEAQGEPSVAQSNSSSNLQIEKLQSKVRELSDELRKKSLHKRVSICDETSRELQIQISKLSLKIDDLELDKEQLRNQNEKIKEENKNNRRQNSELQKKNAQFQGKIQKANSIIEESKNQSKDLEERYDNLKSQFTRVKFQATQQKTTNQKLEKENQSLQSQIGEIRAKIMKSRDAINPEQSKEFNKYKNQTDLMIQELKSQNKQISSKISMLKQQNKKKDEEIQFLREGNTEKQSQMLEQIKLLKKQKADKNEQVRKLQQRLSGGDSNPTYDMQIKLSNEQIKNQQLQKQISISKSQVKSKQQRIIQLQARVNELENESIGQESQRKQRYDETQSYFSEKIKRLEGELAEKNHKITIIQREWQGFQQKFQFRQKKLQRKSVNIDKQIQNLKSKVQQKEAQIQQYRSIKKQNDRLRFKLTQRKDQIRSATSSKENEFGQLIVENEFLKQQIQDYDVKLKEFQTDYISKQQALKKKDSLQEVLEGLKQENNQLHDSMIKLQEEHVMMQQQIHQAKGYSNVSNGIKNAFGYYISAYKNALNQNDMEISWKVDKDQSQYCLRGFLDAIFILERLARSLIQLQKTETLKLVVQKIKEMHPAYSTISYLVNQNASNLYQKQEFKLESIKKRYKRDDLYSMIDLAISRDPKNIQNQIERIKMLREDGEILRALTIAQNLIKQNPNQIELLHEIGNLYQDCQEHQKAAEIQINALKQIIKEPILPFSMISLYIEWKNLYIFDLKKLKFIKMDKVKQLFQTLDSNKNGFLCVNQLQECCRQGKLPISNADIHIFWKYDKNSDQRLDLEEFRTFLHYQSSSINGSVSEVSCVQIPPIQIPLWQYMLAGGCGGISGRTLTAPLERIKILSQTQQHLSFRKAVNLIYSRGVTLRSLFAGNLTSCLRIFPTGAISCLVYANLIKYSPIDKRENPTQPLYRLFAGAVAAGISTTLTYPLDVIKACLSVQDYSKKREEREFRGIFQTGFKLYKEAGLKRLYNGLAPTLFTIMPFLSIQLTTYDMLVQRAKQWGLQERVSDMMLFMLCGVVSGGTAQTIIHPIDVIRRNIQLAKVNKSGDMNSYQMFKNLLNRGGIQRLYSGLSAAWMRAMPAAAATLVVRDAVLGRIDK